MAVEYTLLLREEDPVIIKEGLRFLVGKIKEDYTNILIKF